MASLQQRTGVGLARSCNDTKADLVMGRRLSAHKPVVLQVAGTGGRVCCEHC